MSSPAGLEDAARFDPFDVSELVAAAFACPCCLELPATVVLEPDFVAAVASCRCKACGSDYRVFLDEQQAMRLVLAPPHQLPKIARPAARPPTHP